MSIKDKKIVITGASSGFGKMITEIFLGKGAKVLAVARSIDRVDLEHENLQKFACDISTKEGVDKLFDKINADFADPDMFYANAGFAYHEKYETPDWDHIKGIYDTNVFSPIYSLGKMMEIKKDKPFNFIITASAVAYYPVPGMSIYSSTKAAVHNFSSAQRFVMGKGQKIQVVYPVAMKTPFFAVDSEEPVPLPTLVQGLERAVRRAANGIIKGKKNIYISNRFRALYVMTLFTEKLAVPIQAKEAKAFMKWWNKK